MKPSMILIYSYWVFFSSILIFDYRFPPRSTFSRTSYLSSESTAHADFVHWLLSGSAHVSVLSHRWAPQACAKVLYIRPGTANRKVHDNTAGEYVKVAATHRERQSATRFSSPFLYLTLQSNSWRRRAQRSNLLF